MLTEEDKEDFDAAFEEDFEEADTHFQPLSNLSESPGLPSMENWCQQTIHVARAFVEPESSGLRRA